MNIFIIIFMLLIFGICIFNHIREKRIEDILESIKDQETKRTIVYQKMLDEYVKMLSAMELNNHCYNSINDEYTTMNNTFEKLIEQIDKIEKQYTALSKTICNWSIKVPTKIENDNKGVLQK